MRDWQDPNSSWKPSFKCHFLLAGLRCIGRHTGWQYEESQASKAAHSPALPLQARNSEMNMALACQWRRPRQFRWLSCKYVTMFLCVMPWEPTGNESLPWGAIESSRNQEVMSAVWIKSVRGRCARNTMKVGDVEGLRQPLLWDDGSSRWRTWVNADRAQGLRKALRPTWEFCSWVTQPRGSPVELRGGEELRAQVQLCHLLSGVKLLKLSKLQFYPLQPHIQVGPSKFHEYHMELRPPSFYHSVMCCLRSLWWSYLQIGKSRQPTAINGKQAKCPAAFQPLTHF